MRMLLALPIRLIVMMIAGANMLIGAPGINAFAQSLTSLATRIERGGQAGSGLEYGYGQPSRSRVSPGLIIAAVIVVFIILCCCSFQILAMNSGADRECGINPC